MNTRMHSSRMRIARFGGHLWFGRGWCASGLGEEVCAPILLGLYTPVTPPPPRTHTPARLHAGIHTPCPISCWDTPGQTYTCENITFPQLHLRAVTMFLCGECHGYTSRKEIFMEFEIIKALWARFYCFIEDILCDNFVL